MPQQIPVIDRPQPEILKPQIPIGIDRRIQLPRMLLHKHSRLITDQTLGVPERDGRTEAVGPVPRRFGGNDLRQQPCRQLRVLRLLADQLRRALHREPGRLRPTGPGVQPAGRFGRHPQRVDVGQIVAPALHRLQDSLGGDGLERAVPLAHPHLRLVAVRLGVLPRSRQRDLCM